MSCGRALLFLLILRSGEATLWARYSSLIATADGASVSFQVESGLRNTRWYRLQLEGGRPVFQALPQPLADSSDDGATLAFSFYGDRYCGFGGSTCFLAAPCSAGFTVDGPAGKIDRFGRRTLIRLSPTAGRAWIEQSGECRGFGFPAPPEFQGLYTLPGLQRLAAPQGATVANLRPGRRVLTAAGQVLTLSGSSRTQLQLLDETGTRPLQQTFAAAEAVIDGAGRSIVYTDALIGRLRWIDVNNQTDEDLTAGPTTGSAPALSSDGRTLAFLSPEGRLFVYDRPSRAVRRLDGNGEALQEFVLSADGRSAFAVTAANRLVRIDVATGQAQTWLEPFPEIQDAATVLDKDPTACPLICYTPQEPLVQLGHGALLVLRGRYLDQPGWRVRIGQVEAPLQPLSAEAAWFQVGSRLETDTIVPFVVFHPEHPLAFQVNAQVLDRVVTCFGALHQDFGRVVSPGDPARLGEILHLYLTGLKGVEPVPDGVPNPADHLIPVASPPSLIGPGVYESLFFGLAPGQLALQQLDIRVLRYVPADPTQPAPRLFPDLDLSRGCDLPAVHPPPPRSRSR